MLGYEMTRRERMPAGAEMPSQVTARRGIFDGVAEHASRIVSGAAYFIICVVAVVGWAVSGPMFQFSDTWQLLINTSTTILTFLMVALLQNSAKRSDQAVQHKLNAIARALADIMEDHDLTDDMAELEAAVGVEDRESTGRRVAGRRKRVRKT